jgi:ribonuclease BN (tRNA processing enzyme)
LSERWAIRTLGTSHGDPTPTRFNVSTLVVAPSGQGLLIDAGAPALALMMRGGFNPLALRHVIVTHLHEDHIGGLPDIVKFQAKRLPKGADTHVWLPERGADAAIRAFLALAHRPIPEAVVPFHDYAAGTVLEWEGARLAAIPTDHAFNERGTFPSYALTLDLPNGRRILFTGDLARDFHDFPAGTRADLAFCELTYYDLAKAIPTLARETFRQLVFTHIGNEWQTPDAPASFADLANRLPYPARIADDGDAFEI